MESNCPDLRICIVTRGVIEPIDEGFKKVAYNLIKSLSAQHQCLVVGKDLSSDLGINFEMNGMFISKRFFQSIRTFCPDVILYMPSSSHTIYSFIQAKFLSYVCNKVAIVGLQPIRYKWWQMKIIERIKPSLIYVQSEKTKKFWQDKGFNAYAIKAGVDLCKYKIVDHLLKSKLRKRYNIPLHKKVLLHVGHINKGRGLEELLAFLHDGIVLVIVGSTSTMQDIELRNKLKKKGCLVISSYVELIEQFYQLSDLYVFPTINYNSAIEYPLSVIEALACGIPVIARPFGALADDFEGDKGVYFYDTVNEGKLKITQILDRSEKDWQEKISIKSYSWESISKNVITTLSKLVE